VFTGIILCNFFFFFKWVVSVGLLWATMGEQNFLWLVSKSNGSLKDIANPAVSKGIHHAANTKHRITLQSL
jgi:hypothetical protein